MTLMNVIALVGGLGLFLFGMKVMTDGLEKTAGAGMRRILEKLTHNRLLAMLAGFAITALVQSSSATTVMLVGFTNAGIMTLRQAVGVIFGANIGKTVTSLLLSVEIDFGAILCALGLLLLNIPGKRFRKARNVGPVLMGLGILFVGMEMMGDAMAPLGESDGFRQVLLGISNPLIGVLIGAGITAILQSSAASIGILQVLAADGLIPLRTSLFILFGQNIGTCITAILACPGTNAAAKRTAAVHLLFNVIGAVLFTILACVLPMASWVEALVPGSPKLQIAIAHVAFNVATTLVLLPFANLLEKLACRLVPDRESEDAEMRLAYFDRRLMKTPTIAAAQLFREVQRMGDIARQNLTDAVACFHQWDDGTAAAIARREDVLDWLEREITTCLVDVKGLDLNEKDTLLVGSMFHVVNDMERVGDHAVNLLDSGRMKQAEDVKFSAKAVSELEDLSNTVVAQLDEALDIFRSRDESPERREKVERTEQQIDDTTEALRNHHVDRLKNKKCSAKNGMIYLDVLTNLERIGDHAENIATSLERVRSAG